jgi:hypothetical protein
MKQFFAVLIMVGIVFSACKKTASSPVSSEPLASFQPITAGSQWNYNVTETLNPSSSLLLSAAEVELGYSIPAIDTSWTTTITATSTDTVIAGLSYVILTNGADAEGNLYTSQKDSNYYGIGIIPQFSLTGIGSLATQAPILYLKDTLTGTSWQQVVIAPGVGGVTDTTTYTITITAVNGTMAVNGTTYKNVTTETVKALPSGISSLAGAAGVPAGIDLSISGTYYFARSVGLIEVNIDASLYGFQYLQTLTSSSIN